NNIIISTTIIAYVNSNIIIIWVASLASARKSAADSHYDTTDEEKFGRGQRTLKKNYNKHILHEIEENDDDDDLDDEGNNKENDDNSNERNKKSSKHLKQKNVDKITRENVKINFELTSISKRLGTLESCRHNNIEPAENDMAMIISLLPIKTVESMKEFDDLIKSNEAAASQFKKFISKIGGNTPRINIHRALERTISNICAINCSWKGVRSNYKICNLTFIKIIRDIVCSIHSGLTEAEFDVTSAEWFRFAKQRAAREEKKRNL
ncbi:uncharacterized protein, partial [Temnothorax longispinosus]|uniref:uncharacterized protein n=1 Tax=Temnothorax longispinosus TaxID=300112 RepID=UPI003A994A69